MSLKSLGQKKAGNYFLDPSESVFMGNLPDHMRHSIRLPEKPRPFDPARELDELTELALKRKREILSLDLPKERAVPTREEHQRLQLILAASDSTINQKIKVDEVGMRQQQSDGLPALLERMAKAIKGE